MAEKQGQYGTFSPSEAAGIHMAVIECRTRGGHEWLVHSLYDDRNEVNGGYLSRRCEKLANRSLDCEFRYRAATLTFDDDGRKCVIY